MIFEKIRILSACNRSVQDIQDLPESASLIGRVIRKNIVFGKYFFDKIR